MLPWQLAAVAGGAAGLEAQQSTTLFHVLTAEQQRGWV
jgi:hypothetical protein